MSSGDEHESIHPLGEGEAEPEEATPVHRVETVDSPVPMEWVDEAGMSMHATLTYAVEVLKVSGLWERFVAECPPRHGSPNVGTADS